MRSSRHSILGSEHFARTGTIKSDGAKIASNPIRTRIPIMAPDLRVMIDVRQLCTSYQEAEILYSDLKRRSGKPTGIPY